MQAEYSQRERGTSPVRTTRAGDSLYVVTYSTTAVVDITLNLAFTDVHSELTETASGTT